MAIVVVGSVDVVVRTRGEHCPPHVHAICLPEGWGARFRFSFLNDDVIHWDIHMRSRAPTSALLTRIGRLVRMNLEPVRMRWWNTMRTTCLDRQFSQVAEGRLTLCGRSAAGARQIASATYEPVSRVLVVRFADLSIHQQSV